MKKHLLVSYAWSINNIGDMGIQGGLFTLLKEKSPDLAVKLINYLPENDPAYAHYKEVLPPYNPKGEVLPMPFFDLIAGDPMPDAVSESIRNAGVKGNAWHNLVSRHGKLKLEQFRTGTISSFDAEKLTDDLLNRFPLEIMEDLKLHFPDLADAFANAGFVYYNSGTTLNFGRLGVRRLFGYTLPLAMSLILARALKIPYGIGSQSFDLIEWPMDLLYDKLFADAEFVYCRDTDSLNYLKQKKFSFKTIDFRPDTTVYFNGGDDAWKEEFFAAKELEEGKFMTVALRISAPKPKYHDPTGGSVTPERCRHQMEQMKYLVEEYIKMTGHKVLIAHETRDTLEDARIHLYNILSDEAKASTVYLEEFWTPEQALSVYRATSLLVSVEMHSIIMAIGNGVPFIHAPYVECGRKRQMVRDMELPEFLIDLDDEDSGKQMVDRARMILENRPQIRERLQKVRKRLAELSAKSISEVGTFFK
ncbi:MAG: polysaccharide pyruvyl transferase family protein [Lentisphaeria bacterium]|nr:polysaccharide pyruvyl transferase family protein [Lentisphaeria bacterium]